MGLRTSARHLLNSYLRNFGYELFSSSLLYDWQRDSYLPLSYEESVLPVGAANYLQPNNLRLKSLQDRYANLKSEVSIPLLWKEGHVKPEDLQYFRGNNAYVVQLRKPNLNMMGYALTTFYVKSIDNLGLLQKLEEDEYFGAITFFIDNKKISRDLLDSITEIYFLEKYLNISSLSGPTILDIGAGYGRLAHRMVNVFPNIQNFLCTDAIALSTFISEYYLGFRKLEKSAKVIPLDEIESTLENQNVNVAVNVHSFSECSIPAIDWWLSLLEKYRIKYLMIVPNAMDHGGDLLLTYDRQDIRQVIEKHGYKLIVKEPKFKDPVVQKYAINPTYYYLFELR